MMWYQTNLQVVPISLSLGIGGEDITRPLGIFEFPGSRGRHGEKNPREIEGTVDLIVH